MTVTTTDDARLEKIANVVRGLFKATVKNIIEIGEHLAEAKELAGHGNWLGWLELEFKWSDRTAQRFINAYERFGANPTLVSDLDPSSVYLLAAPSTPETARDEVIERAKSGPVSRQQVKEIVKKRKTSAPPPKPKPTIEPTRDVEQSEAPTPKPGPIISPAVGPAPAPPQDTPANLVPDRSRRIIPDIDPVVVALKQVDGIVYELEAVAKRLRDIESTAVIAAMSIDHRREYVSRLRGTSQIINEWGLTWSCLPTPDSTSNAPPLPGQQRARRRSYPRRNIRLRRLRPPDPRAERPTMAWTFPHSFGGKARTCCARARSRRRPWAMTGRGRLVPTEQQLLNTIFADGAAPNERETAIAALKKLTSMDRAGLVEKYTNDPEDGDAEAYRSFWELEKNRRHAAEVERDAGLIDLRDAQKHLRKFEEHTRKLASIMLEAKWLDAQTRADIQTYTEVRPSTEAETERLINALWRMANITVWWAVLCANTSRFGQARPAAEPPSPNPEPTAAASTEPPRIWTNYETPASRRLNIVSGKSRKVPYPVKPIEDVCAAYGLVLTPTSSAPDLPPDYPVWRGGRCGDAATLFTTPCSVCGGMMHVSTTLQRWTCQCDRNFPYRKYHAPDVIGLVERLTGCSHLQALWWVIGTGVQPQRKEPLAPPPDEPKTRRTRKTGGREAPRATPQ